MSIVSFLFFVFLAISLLVYYIVPIRFRWVVIFVSNVYFLYCSNSVYLNLLWLGCALLTYAGANIIAAKRESKPRIAKLCCCISVLVILIFLLVLKDSAFFIDIYNGVISVFKGKTIGGLSLLAPIGISYYTLVWIGYLLDVYWGTCSAEKNVLKFLTFCGFFPVMTSGPIARYQEIGVAVTTGHSFDYKNVTFGIQRICWGLMKKLIISERLAIVVNTIYSDTYMYPGVYVWLAMILFAFQLYTDFSGCIDIAIGTAEAFGVVLPENFNLPFISETLAEFWRRWHITLGGWLRDYILYPLLKSESFQKIGNFSKKTFGKKIGKKIPTWIGLTISWFLIGFWHGGHWNYIIGVGLFFGMVIILSEMLTPLFDRFKKFANINTETHSYKAFQRVRTFIIFMTGLAFFRAGSVNSALVNLKNAVSVSNPWVLWDGSLNSLGLEQSDIYILILFGILLIVSGVLSNLTGKSLRVLVAEQNLVYRWILYLLLVYSIIVFGCYGVDFDSASFIYQGF